MALGIPNLPPLIPYAIGGVIHNFTAARLSTAVGAGNIKTPTANFSIHKNRHTLSFEKNVPFVTDPELTAALTAANAPVV